MVSSRMIRRMIIKSTLSIGRPFPALKMLVTLVSKIFLLWKKKKKLFMLKEFSLFSIIKTVLGPHSYSQIWSIKSLVFVLKEISLGLEKNLSWTLLGLMRGFCKLISNGITTKIWDNPWFDNLSLVWWPTYISLNEIANVSFVDDLISSSFF